MTTTDKLAEAIELAEEAMAYVPEYFANKHGMNRRMAALKEAAAHDAEQAAKAVPADLRSAAERTRQDLGPTGSNYPDVRVLLAFVEQALAAPTPQPAQAERVGLTDEQIAEGRYRTWAAEPEDAPEAWSFLRGARWAESALAVRWGVKLGATTGQEPAGQELPPIDDYLPTDGPRWTTANFIACVERYATDYARAALAQRRQPLTDEDWRTRDSSDTDEGCAALHRAHGIGATTGKQR